MAEPAPASGSRLDWRGEDSFELDGVRYECRPVDDRFASSAERFCIRKPHEDVLRLERLLDDLGPERMVELGIDAGGSTALIAQLCRPELLLAFDIAPEPAPGLDQFIAERGLKERVRPAWGVDQADGERLARISSEALDGRALDLVIDDASHLLGPTRASFEALFPLLRPGGVFVIEDWDWAHSAIAIRPGQAPLTGFVFELVLAAAAAPELIASVEVSRGWALARRGAGEFGPGGLSVRSLLGERALGLLPDERAGTAHGESLRRRLAAIFRRP